jgi:hypothetical protein
MRGKVKIYSIRCLDHIVWSKYESDVRLNGVGEVSAREFSAQGFLNTSAV